MIEGRDEHPVAGGTGPAIGALDETTLRLTGRWERLATRPPGPARPELEELLTESCTQSYMLEAQRLHTKRRMVTALADASPQPAEEAREEVRELVDRYWSITAELERVEGVIARVRARLAEMQPT